MFPDLVYTGGGGGGSKKKGDHQKKKFLTSNSVEALILFNKEYHGLY